MARNGSVRKTELFTARSGEDRRSGRGLASFFANHNAFSNKRLSKKLVPAKSDPEQGTTHPSVFDSDEDDFFDDDSVISGGGVRVHGFDMVGEPHATPIAVLPDICCIDVVKGELERSVYAFQ
jgi:hypothetical protein